MLPFLITYTYTSPEQPTTTPTLYYYLLLTLLNITIY